MTDANSIAIVGGGPGGLTLANILAVHGIRATVFELDASPAARGQGGSLDLHATAQEALAVAGLRDEFLRVARYEDQDARIYSASGALLYEESGLGGDRPEVDRGALRTLLLDALPAETIAWGKRVTLVERTGNGAAVHCAGEAPRAFDLVIGADGTWSRVRPLVSDVRPAYTGTTFVELELDGVDANHPVQAALVPRGKLMALTPGRALIAQRSSGGHLRTYVAQVAAESWAREVRALPVATLKQELLRHYSDYAPALRGLIERAAERAHVLPLYALPVGHTWTHAPGVTLLGDAAHVMSPFAGEGVNNAMTDALELARAILDGGDRDAAIARYEAEMFARVTDSARDSEIGLEQAMGPDNEVQMIALMRSHRPPEVASAHSK